MCDSWCLSPEGNFSGAEVDLQCKSFLVIGEGRQCCLDLWDVFYCVGVGEVADSWDLNLPVLRVCCHFLGGPWVWGLGGCVHDEVRLCIY